MSPPLWLAVSSPKSLADSITPLSRPTSSPLPPTPSAPSHSASPLGPQTVSVNEVSILPPLLFSYLSDVSFWSRFPSQASARLILPPFLLRPARSLQVSYFTLGTSVTTLLKMVEPSELALTVSQHRKPYEVCLTCRPHSFPCQLGWYCFWQVALFATTLFPH